MSIARKVLAGTVLAGAAIAFTAGTAVADLSTDQSADRQGDQQAQCGQAYADYVPDNGRSHYEGYVIDRYTNSRDRVAVDFDRNMADVQFLDLDRRFVGQADYQDNLGWSTRLLGDDETTAQFRTQDVNCYGERGSEASELTGIVEFNQPLDGHSPVGFFTLHRVDQ